MTEEKLDTATQYQIERVRGLNTVNVTPSGVESEGAGEESVWKAFQATYEPDLKTPLANSEGRGDNSEFIREYYRTAHADVFALITKDARTKRVTAREVMKVGPKIAEAWNNALTPKK